MHPAKSTAITISRKKIKTRIHNQAAIVLIQSPWRRMKPIMAHKTMRKMINNIKLAPSEKRPTPTSLKAQRPVTPDRKNIMMIIRMNIMIMAGHQHGSTLCSHIVGLFLALRKCIILWYYAAH